MYNYDDSQKEKEETMKPAAPSCYGCTYMVASPAFDCVHPNSIRVLWDPIRHRSYRIPSVTICREQGGLCKFYEPAEDRGAEYSLLTEFRKLKEENTMEKLVGDLIDNDEVDKFLGLLNKRLLDDEDKEEE